MMIWVEVRRHAPLGGRRFEVPAVLVEVLESPNWRYNWSWWLVNKMKMRFWNEEILSFILNVSLKYYADVIAGRQIGQIK